MNGKCKFQFGNVVVVHNDKIGLIVKSWDGGKYNVYVRLTSDIELFDESEIKHFVYSKYLHDDELDFYDQI